MTKKRVLAFTGLVLATFAAYAVTVPNVFTANTAARAADVNANFAALVSAVTTLEQKVAALEAKFAPPTMASLAGTYDLLEHRVDVDVYSPTAFSIGSISASATVILKADGTGSATSSSTQRRLNFSNSNVGFIGTTEGDTGNFMWKLAGGKVVIQADGDVSFIVASDRILLGLDRSDEGPDDGLDGLSVLIRR